MMNAAPALPTSVHPLLAGDGTFVLSELCRIHDEERHPLGLDEVFGDGALLRRLPTLARLRRAVVESGHRFVSLTTLSTVYESLPLLMLADILDTRTIPYRANAGAMREVARAAPGMHFDELTFRDTSPQCLTTHESAHALYVDVAREVEGDLLGRDARVPGSPAAHRFAEVLVASEGFALAYDIFVILLGLADGRRSTMHLLSVCSAADQYGFHGYERQHPGVMHRLAKLAVRHPAAVLRLLSSGCYIANLRPHASSKVGPELLRWLEDVTCFPPGHHDEARAIASVGLTIDHAFRMRTAPTLFRFLGIEDEFHAVCAAPLEEAFSPDAPFLANLDTVVDRVTTDSGGDPSHHDFDDPCTEPS